MITGYVQFSPALADLDSTLERLDTSWPANPDADLVVLPELCNSGYALRDRDQARSIAEEVGDSRFLRYIQDRCRKDSTYVVTGFAERAGSALYNSAILVGPEGIAGSYRKLHLFLNEPDIFSPGDQGLPIFEVQGVKLGIMICFDWAFPEAWRTLALRGADVIAHPSNLVLPGKAQLAARAHAMTNRFFVITANRIGTEAKLSFTGRSQIVGLDGERLVHSEDAEPSCAYTSISPLDARKKSVTPRNDLLADRRTEVYDLQDTSE